MNKMLLFWSTGKDSAYVLQLLRGRQDVEVVGLFTTMTRPGKRVAVHDVSEALLMAQAHACGLPVTRVSLPHPCPNHEYETIVLTALEDAERIGVTHVAFGDLYLEDIRAYRETLFVNTGITPIFPLWMRDTRELAEEMVAAGLRARITCVDTKLMPYSFAGREFDQDFLNELPAGVDPCGEKGEFHTFAYAGPMFHRRIDLRAGTIQERNGFAYAEMIPD